MFNRKQKEIDRLNARCIELARQLRDSNLENKELKEIRKKAASDNSKLIIVIAKQNKILSEINKITTQNTYGNKESNYNKIKELVSDYQSLN